MEYFSSSTQFDGHANVSSPMKLDEKPIRSVEISTTTPPQKRRRGRPPKCPSASDGQPSPAAHLSAAVVKQGTPKASAPLMRISPLRGKRRESQSSPIQRIVNPSPKGGLLMKLDNNDQEKPVSKKAKRSSSSSTDAIYSMTLAANKTKKDNNFTMDNFVTPTKISLSAQEGIHSLTGGSSKAVKTSVNPSLLLSSPMPNSHGFNNKKKSQADNKTNKRKGTKLNSRTQTTMLSSSPATPNSLASSCFSSIIQSSPLYHGYYANQSSPNPLTSSPIKFQMKPIELPDLKRQSNKNDGAHLPKIDEIPKNPFNSPNLKPQENNSPSPTKGEFQLSFSIDERGQAQVIKVKTVSKSIPQASARPTFTRHESLMNISQNPYNLGRSSSLSNIHAHKSQPSISGVLEESSSQDYNEMFIEPLKMTSDPLLSEFNQTIDLENLPNSDNSSLMDDENEVEDESMNYDARNALIKMIRRSV